MIYSFRAECRADVEDFLRLARGEIVREKHLLTVSGETAFVDIPIMDITRLEGDPFPDVAIEFESPSDLAALKALCDLVEDGHVMRETLRPCPLNENNLKRTKGAEHLRPGLCHHGRLAAPRGGRALHGLTTLY